MVALDIPVVISQIQAGNLMPIGMAGDKRDAVLPDVPTLAEQGYPNTDASNWYALLAPGRRRRAVIAKLNKRSMTHSRIRDPREARQGRRHADRRHAGAFGAFMKAEYDKWGRVVQTNGTQAVVAASQLD